MPLALYVSTCVPTSIDSFLLPPINTHPHTPNKQAGLDDPQRGWSVAQFLEHHKYGPEFANYYIVPMCAALWSSSAVRMYAEQKREGRAVCVCIAVAMTLTNPHTTPVRGNGRMSKQSTAAMTPPSDHR